jgi:anti-sigma B factor antagonist
MPDQAVAKIRAKTENGVTTVCFNEKKILEETVIGQIAEELNKLLESGQTTNMLLDFADVDHLSSAALGMLIILNSNVRRRGGRLKMCNIKPEIHEVFEITRLHKLFEIHDDAAKALAGFRDGR